MLKHQFSVPVLAFAMVAGVVGGCVFHGDRNGGGPPPDGGTPFDAAGDNRTDSATGADTSGSDASGTDGGTVIIGVPSNLPAWSGSPTVTGAIPTIVYPSDQTRFPRNIYRTLFQWRSQGYSEFRLTFDGGRTKVVVYTDGQHALCAGKTPAAACWEADQASWAAIAGGNAGLTVTWTVDGLDTTTSPPTIRRSASITIGFSSQDVVGAIFYWSTTSAGIRRANVAAAEPEDYITGSPGTVYSNPNDQVKCVACHVVSRDGKYLIAPVQATSGQSVWSLQVTSAAPPTPLVKTIANTGGHGFATISPDDTYIVPAFKGKLWMVDRATGAFIKNIGLAGLMGTQPDWSPDDSQLVFATGQGDAPSGASLSTMSYTSSGQSWGAPTTLVPAGGASNLFPMHSPDGKWIAYSRGKGGHDDLTAQLFLTAAKAPSTPVELVNANRVVSNQTGNGQTENSQPTWAPPGDLNWVAFNSKRAYGVVQPAGRQQIWVAAVDVNKVAQGVDPSYPAFRLQFQGLQEDNHRAYWTLDVRDTPDGGTPPRDAGAPLDSGMCIASNATCDPGTSRCCDPTYDCDTMDDGVTYKCYPVIIP